MASNKEHEEHQKRNGVKKGSSNLNYMHREPTIIPNYGKKKQRTPRSSLARVLLYDNANQQHVLKNRLSQIKLQQRKSVHFLDMRKNSFLIRRGQRVRELKEESKREKNSLLPDIRNNRGTGACGSTLSPEPSTEHEEDSEDLSPIAVIIEHIKLPEIDPDREKRHLVFKLKDNYGDTKIYHTEDDGIMSDVVPLHTIYSKTTDDPRFSSLENVLIPAKSTQ